MESSPRSVPIALRTIRPGAISASVYLRPFRIHPVALVQLPALFGFPPRRVSTTVESPVGDATAAMLNSHAPVPR